MGAEHADEAGAGHEHVLAGHVQAGERGEQGVLGLRHHPAQVLLGPDGGPVRRLDAAQPRGGDGRLVGLVERAGHGVLVLHVGEPEVEALVDGHVQRVAGHEVLQARALARGVGEPDDADLAGLGLGDRLLQHRPEVARRVAEVVLDLQAQPDRAGLAHHRGRRHRQQRAQHDLAVGPGEGQRRRTGRDELAQRDHVALRGQPLEGALHEGGERGAGLALDAVLLTHGRETTRRPPPGGPAGPGGTPDGP